VRVAWLACLLLLGTLACTTSEADGSGADGAGGGNAGAGGASACYDGCVAEHPKGAILFEDLADCLICAQCYDECGQPPDCPVPDPDAGEPECAGTGICSDDDPGSNDCASCALDGPCKEVFSKCQGSSDCLTFGQCIEQCS
jgi:hypothetical protein